MARLDRTRVLEEALALADEVGLDELSLRGVAERLGVTPMALYRHVAGKDDLLDGVADLLYGELDLPEPGDDWWEALARIARSTRAVLLAHPRAAGLFARPLAGPSAFALDDALARALRDAGFSRAEARELHDQLSGMAFALVAPELRGRPNRAAFERGIELLHAGLEARRPQE
jgi:AcrR family transcriptional regulator